MIANRSALAFIACLLAPALIYILVIVAYPLADTIHLSFTNASLNPVTRWVGFDNYARIFNGRFPEVIGRTVIWTFFSVATKMVIGTCGAVLLNAALPGRALFRVLLMPPWIIPIAIGVFTWGWLYNGQFGMISGLLQRFGVADGPVEFLAYGNLAFWATIVTDVWIGVPLTTIYLLAAVQAIPTDLYEAAWVDGAGRFYRFRRITLPLILPALAVMSMISLISTFNSFDIIWILTRGGPRDLTTTMIIDTYRTALGSYHYGEGAARAVMICLFMSVFCFFYFRILSRISRTEAPV